MTLTSVRYKTYEDYLRSDLSSEANYRLLSNGEVIALPPEDEKNICIATELLFVIGQFVRPRTLIRTNSTEVQVRPVGDGGTNRKPDLVVLLPEHAELMANLRKSAVLLDMPAPAFVAEVVSPGGPGSDSYRRDYEWKRQQYQELQIPEYWIIDRHRQQVTVLILQEGAYVEQLYKGKEIVHSEAFPKLNVSAGQVLSAGDI